MEKLNLPPGIKRDIEKFTEGLDDIYGNSLISIILYGSAASGEFTHKQSNVNLLIVLDDVSLHNLKKARGIVNKPRFSVFNPIFLTEEYIRNSADVFPVEFLDIKDRYLVLCGRDIFSDLEIDARNLRFQCEQELKVKLINLRQFYLRSGNDRAALTNLLFRSFTSILHILRNLLCFKGLSFSYLKEDIVKEIVREFKVEGAIWEKILSAKAKKIRLSGRESRRLFISFTQDLEKIVDIVDKL